MDMVYWLIPGRLGARPGPNKEPWDLTELKTSGVSLVVSLSERMLNRSDEFAALGIDHVCLPLPKSVPPKRGDALDIEYILPHVFEIVAHHLATDAGHCVLVHCSSGKDRSGLFLTYFLMRSEHVPLEAALNRVKQIQPKLLTARGWWEMGQQVLTSLSE